MYVCKVSISLYKSVVSSLARLRVGEARVSVLLYNIVLNIFTKNNMKHIIVHCRISAIKIYIVELKVA